MNEFQFDYVKPKYGVKLKLCCMDTDSFIAYIKTGDIQKGITEDVETKFNTSNYELVCNSIDRPLPKVKSKKVIELMKNELDEKIMTKFVGLITCLITY